MTSSKILSCVARKFVSQIIITKKLCSRKYNVNDHVILVSQQTLQIAQQGDWCDQNVVLMLKEAHI